MFKKLVSILGLTAAHMNDDFEQVLYGKTPLSAEKSEEMWAQWDSTYRSKIPHRLLNDRKETFLANLEDIIAHNSDSSNTWSKGINQFTDLSNEEFAAYSHTKLAVGEAQHCSATDKRMSVAKNAFDPPPHHRHHFDWRDFHRVSPVKDQGHCGSCWTFSTVGTLEAHTMIKYQGHFASLSEQQLVDCAQEFDNHGCEGGLPSHAFEYIMHAGGISTEDAYPYFAKDNKCSVDPKTFAVQVHGGSVNITEGDEEEMMEAVWRHGPVSIAFQVVDGF